MTQDQRPACYGQQHADFLNKLRDGGTVNMFGAVPYLRQRFPGLTEKDATAILMWWMLECK